MCSTRKILVQDVLNALSQSNLHNEDRILYAQNEVTDVQTDSRLISKNSAFVCIKGFRSDGHDFANTAVKNGCNLLIVTHFLDIEINQIKVNDSRKASAVLSLLIHGNPSESLSLIGVTGTNGKTTITFFTFQLLKSLGHRVGLIGTLGYWIQNKFYASERTTPDILELHNILRKMKLENIAIVVMEVSSHAIALDRIFGLIFKVAAFTNLTRDHLDFHSSMEEYANFKYKFLQQTAQHKGQIYINTDDQYGLQFSQKLNCKTISCMKDADYTAANVNMKNQNTSFLISHRGETLPVVSPLLGLFNVYNLVTSFCLVKEFHPNETQIIKNIKKIEQVPGRLEKIEINNNTAVVDYAHTPDALLNVLQTLKKITKGRVIVVVGAGGDRDSGKRNVMGEIAVNNSELTIFTNDNPRSENPRLILKDLIPTKKNWILYEDRKTAIEVGLALLKKNDVLLVAGKGHENYQEINGEKHFFSDKMTIEKYIYNIAMPQQNGVGTIELSVPLDKFVVENFFHTSCSINELLYFVSTDTRTIVDNSIYFALKGDSYDGHKFVNDALKKANTIAVISDETYFEEGKTILVDNVLTAYHTLAKFYLSLFNIQKIALTGSYGKTTTKQFLYNILSQKAEVIQTFANENNLIGTPRTIFKLEPKHDFAIFEFGTNTFGEIERLANLVEPKTALVTAIAASHLQGLGSIHNVFFEKSKIFKHAVCKIASKDSDFFKNFEGITVGEKEQNLFKITNITKTSFDLNDETYPIISEVPFHSLNIGYAIAIAKYYQYDFHSIYSGLRILFNNGLRMKKEAFEDSLILWDCYNANPESMKKAIAYWDELDGKNKILIVGDMLELGNETDRYHNEIGKQIQQTYHSLSISIGNHAKAFACDFHFSSVDDFIHSEVIEKIKQPYTILVKASNGINLSKLVGRI